MRLHLHSRHVPAAASPARSHAHMYRNLLHRSFQTVIACATPRLDSYVGPAPEILRLPLSSRTTAGISCAMAGYRHHPSMRSAHGGPGRGACHAASMHSTAPHHGRTACVRVHHLPVSNLHQLSSSSYPFFVQVVPLAHSPTHPPMHALLYRCMILSARAD